MRYILKFSIETQYTNRVRRSPELVDNTYNHTGIAEEGQSSAVKHKSMK